VFHEQVDCRDSDIFITIPCLLILKSLEDDAEEAKTASKHGSLAQSTLTSDQQICKRFYPSMFKQGDDAYKTYNELKVEYNRVKGLKCGP
jgi:hypothetical protein